MLVATLIGAVAGAPAVPAEADDSPLYRIVDLGVGDYSSATAINDLGHVVGGDQYGRPFLWRDRRITYLFGPDGSGVVADINNRDEVVGSRVVNDNGDMHAFLWRNGVVTDLGVLPGGDTSYAESINDRGEVVGSSATEPGGNGGHAFRWRDGVMTDLGDLPGGSGSVAKDINNTGTIVGFSAGTSYLGVRWLPDGAIQPLGDTLADAVAVNDLGDITGWVFDGGGIHGYLWQQGQVTEFRLPGPPAAPKYLLPFEINNQVQIVGSADSDAFVWREGQLTTLPSLGSSSRAFDINDRGQIVGYSTMLDPNGNWIFRAVLWAPSGA